MTQDQKFTYEEILNASAEAKVLVMDAGKKVVADYFKKQYGSGLCFLSGAGMEAINYKFLTADTKLKDAMLLENFDKLSQKTLGILESKFGTWTISELIEKLTREPNTFSVSLKKELCKIFLKDSVFVK